jgi:hypothetical protein
MALNEMFDVILLEIYSEISPQLNEPLYTRPAWFILSEVEGYSGVRASPYQSLLTGRATRCVL